MAQLSLGGIHRLCTLLLVQDLLGIVIFRDIVESVELTNDGTDAIEGVLSFRGKLGKKDVELKEDKNGKIFLVFSAFSVDKTKDVAEFSWVNFLYFDPQNEDFLKPGTYIDAKGSVQFGVYNDAITLDCIVSEVKPWVLEKK